MPDGPKTPPTRGRTPGSGKPKGYKAPATLEKEAIREHVRQRVAAELDPMLSAQIANAKGLQHFVLRDKAGKFEKVTSEAAAIAAMNDPAAVYEFWTKDPSVQAFTDLLNRTIDKPKEQEQEIKLTGDSELLARLDAGRLRAAGLTKR